MVSDNTSRFFDSYERAGKRPRFFAPSPTTKAQEVEANAGSSTSSTSLKQELEAVLGPLSEDALAILLPLAATDLSGTINSWLDGNIQVESHDSLISEDLHSCPGPDAGPSSSSPNEIATGSPESQSLLLSCLDGETDQNTNSDEPVLAEQCAPQQKQTMFETAEVKKWDRRLLGSFHAVLWSTRSGRDLVKFGESLKFERPPSVSRTSGHEDFIIRVRNVKGLDFARVSEGDAKFMAVLMDLRICEFEGNCVYVDDRLRSGDSIDVQVNCYICRNAFVRDIQEITEAPTVGSDAGINKRGFVDESAEAMSEALVRQRQVAIILVFAKLGLSDPKLPDPKQATELLTPSSSASEQPTPVEEEAALTDEQINVLAEQTSSRPTLIETDPPSSFAFTLHGYQKQALSWMLEKEGVELHGEETRVIPSSQKPDDLHPLWTRFQWPESDELFYVNFNSGEFSIPMPTLETTSLGGILADEMGLGKTITTSALIHASKVPKSFSGYSNVTLVVVPMSLLSQWESEIIKSSKPNTIKTLTYYGSRGSELQQFLAGSKHSEYPRVILTSYGVIASEYRQLKKFRDINGLQLTVSLRSKVHSDLLGLFAVNFYRIVLDEAHTIKNRNTLSSKACCELKAAKRWALTGTPVVNRLEDLFSLIKFLGLEPWRNFSYWRAFVTIPFQTQSGVQEALKTVQSIVAPLCLRRTKDMEKDGKPLVDLPEKTVEVRRIPFSPTERDLYAFIYNRIRSSVSKKVSSGDATKNYASIMTLILRVRQICCHPKLLPWANHNVISSSNEEEIVEANDNDTSDPDLLDFQEEELKDLMKKFRVQAPENLEVEAKIWDAMERAESEIECPICSQESIPNSELAITKCLHFGCFCCLLAHIQFQEAKGNDNAGCPMCREPITASDLFLVNRKQQVVKRNNAGQQSAKTFALIQELRKNPGNGKNVVFSQFTSLLDIIASELDFHGIRHVRFDGSMDMKRRSAALDEFRSAKGDRVLLLSLKAGGVGLNLVEAQQAFLMDPWWSYAIEAQAIDRIHRMGQTGSVRVVRFIIEGTIEERILKIQARKAALSSAVTDEANRSERLDDIRDLFELDE